MAESYSLAGAGYALQGEGYNLQAMTAETERATRAFDELLKIEREKELQTRREIDLEKQRKQLTTDRITNLQREIAAGQQVASQISSVGRVITDLLGGRLMNAFRGVVSMIQQMAQGASSSASGDPGAPGSGKGGASVAKLVGGGKGPTGGSPLGGVATTGAAAAAALGAVVGAAGAAYDTFMKFAGAALPQGVQALNTAFRYLLTVVGSAVAPYLLYLGATIVFIADLVKDLMPKILAMFEDGGDGFVRVITWIVKAILFPLTGLEHAVKALTYGWLKLLQQLNYAMAWVLKKVQFKTQAKNVDAIGDWFGEQAKQTWKIKSPTEMIGKAIADQIGGIKIGGKGIRERFGDSVGKFANTVMMGSGMQGTAGFEGVDAAYKRLQEFAAGTTPLEQEILDTQQKALQQLIEMAGGIKGIEKKIQPAIGR